MRILEVQNTTLKLASYYTETQRCSVVRGAVDRTDHGFGPCVVSNSYVDCGLLLY